VIELHHREIVFMPDHDPEHSAMTVIVEAFGAPAPVVGVAHHNSR